MSETLTSLSECLRLVRSAAKRAAAWAEAADLFPHHAKVARTFAANANDAAKEAVKAAGAAAKLAPTPEQAKSEQAHKALADVQHTREYAEQAIKSATHAIASAKASRRFVPQRGDLADLCKTRQRAVLAWLSCPEGETVKLAVLRARVEEAEAAVQAAMPLPATA